MLKTVLMKKSKISILVILLIFSMATSSYGQDDKDKAYQLLPWISYGIDVPMADMSTRFGSNFGFHGGIDMIFKNQWSSGLFFKYKFGDNLREDVLSSLRLENGEILGSGTSYANVVMNERVIYFGAQIGKSFPFNISKINFSIKADIGAGYMSHLVSIDNTFEDVPQLKGDLIKGYDRLTNGFGINQSLALHYIAPNNWRIFLSIESVQGFTKSMRNIQYDTDVHKGTKRLDILTGVHFGFVMPFSFGNYGSDELYY